MSNLILETKNLSKDFQGTKAVNKVNLKVNKGDIYGFLGPNGAGKTTTLKLILDLIKPTSGEAFVNGINVQKNGVAALKKVGAMIETPKFYDSLSGYKNLKVFAQLYGETALNRIDEVLEIVELSNAAHKQVKNYSLGMKQRLGIAKAFINDPDIVILDEPTNGLDPFGMKTIRELIIKLAREYDKTFIVSTHLLAEVELMCTKVGIINHGNLIKELEMSELIKEKNENVSFEDYFISLTEEARLYV